MKGLKPQKFVYQIAIPILSIGFFLTGCKKEEPIPNRPPEAFNVKTELGADGKTITLRWNKAKDPDGDAVTYTVVFGDTLARNLTDTSYVIKGLGYDVKKEGSVIAKDPEGLSSEAAFSVATAANPYVAIPDQNFEKYLIEQKIDKEGLLNGKMLRADAVNVKSINCSDRIIKSLTGIEVFTNLEYLNCNYNQLTGLDVSKNTTLEELHCVENQLANLDVSKNTALKKMRCNYNQLTTLDVSKNTVLEDLHCSYNKLTALDVSKNTALWYLYCQHNQLTGLLDVSKCIKLLYFQCDNNQLTGLDISKNTQLEYLNCENNKIITICVADVAKAQANTSWGKDQTAEYKICN